MKTFVDVAKRLGIKPDPNMDEAKLREIESEVAKECGFSFRSSFTQAYYNTRKIGQFVSNEDQVYKKNMDYLINTKNDGIIVDAKAQSGDFIYHRTNEFQYNAPIERFQIALRVDHPNLPDCINKLDDFIKKHKAVYKIANPDNSSFLDPVDRTDGLNVYVNETITPELTKELYEVVAPYLKDEYHDLLDGFSIKMGKKEIKGIKYACESKIFSRLSKDSQDLYFKTVSGHLDKLPAPFRQDCWNVIKNANSLGQRCAMIKWMNLRYYLAGQEGKNPFQIGNRYGVEGYGYEDKKIDISLVQSELETTALKPTKRKQSDSIKRKEGSVQTEPVPPTPSKSVRNVETKVAPQPAPKPSVQTEPKYPEGGIVIDNTQQDGSVVKRIFYPKQNKIIELVQDTTKGVTSNGLWTVTEYWPDLKKAKRHTEWMSADGKWEKQPFPEYGENPSAEVKDSQGNVSKTVWLTDKEINRLKKDIDRAKENNAKKPEPEKKVVKNVVKMPDLSKLRDVYQKGSGQEYDATYDLQLIATLKEGLSEKDLEHPIVKAVLAAYAKKNEANKKNPAERKEALSRLNDMVQTKADLAIAQKIAQVVQYDKPFDVPEIDLPSEAKKNKEGKEKEVGKANTKQPPKPNNPKGKKEEGKPKPAAEKIDKYFLDPELENAEYEANRPINLDNANKKQPKSPENKGEKKSWWKRIANIGLIGLLGLFGLFGLKGDKQENKGGDVPPSAPIVQTVDVDSQESKHDREIVEQTVNQQKKRLQEQQRMERMRELDNQRKKGTLKDVLNKAQLPDHPVKKTNQPTSFVTPVVVNGVSYTNVTQDTVFQMPVQTVVRQTMDGPTRGRRVVPMKKTLLVSVRAGDLCRNNMNDLSVILDGISSGLLKLNTSNLRTEHPVSSAKLVQKVKMVSIVDKNGEEYTVPTVKNADSKNTMRLFVSGEKMPTSFHSAQEEKQWHYFSKADAYRKVEKNWVKDAKSGFGYYGGTWSDFYKGR